MTRSVIGSYRSHALFCICRAGNMVREGPWLFEASPLASFRDEQFRIFKVQSFREP